MKKILGKLEIVRPVMKIVRGKMNIVRPIVKKMCGKMKVVKVGEQRVEGNEVSGGFWGCFCGAKKYLRRSETMLYTPANTLFDKPCKALRPHGYPFLTVLVVSQEWFDTC